MTDVNKALQLIEEYDGPMKIYIDAAPGWEERVKVKQINRGFDAAFADKVVAFQKQLMKEQKCQ